MPGCVVCVHGVAVVPSPTPVCGSHYRCALFGVVEKRLTCPDAKVEPMGFIDPLTKEITPTRKRARKGGPR